MRRSLLRSRPAYEFPIWPSICLLRSHFHKPVAAEAWPQCTPVAIDILSGREIGMRRGVPIVVFSIILLGLAWPALRRFQAHRTLTGGAVSSCFMICAYECSSTYARFASGAWRLRR